MAERYGVLPHEILTGTRDPLGVRLCNSLFMLDVACFHEHNEAIEQERRDAEARARVEGWNS